MEQAKAIFYILIEPWSKMSFKWGNRRAGKWVKKNEKDPVEEKYPFEKRHQYITKKLKTFTKRRGIKVTTEGRDYLPKGGYIIAPNFTNRNTIPVLYSALGETREVIFVFDKVSGNKKFPGYAKASNSFIVDWTKPEEAANTIHAAATYAKTFNKALVLFPEGTPNEGKGLKEFNSIVYEVAKKHFMPVVPTSISNLEKVNYRDLKITKVHTTFHTVMKPMQFMNLKPERFNLLIKDKIESKL
jgi:1-acyl-sn-glycerol-3-phosphate acyltransferase